MDVGFAVIVFGVDVGTILRLDLGAETMIQISRRIAGRFMLLVAGVFCLVAESTPRPVWAQVVFGNQPLGTVESVDESAKNLTTLQTDPELEAILEKAKRFQTDGNYRVATKLMQAVLELSLIHI